MSKPTQEEMVDILLAARDRVADGWCQGQFYQEGNVCLLGAMGVAAAGRPIVVCATEVEKQAYYSVCRVVEAQLVQSRAVSSSIAVFNDSFLTTKQDVIDLLNDTALSVKAGDIEV